MKAIEIKEFGAPEMLVPCARPIPKPGPEEVLIRVEAAGVNRPDVLQRMGLYPPPPGASDLPGLEAAGIVEAIGEDVSTLKPGDEVCALLTGGGYAQFALAHHGSCLPVPAGLSLEQAASLPETIFTVWANVFDDAGLKSGETLLVHGGTSGIGVTAITLAKAIGARVITTAGDSEKCAAAEKLGADEALVYKSDDWHTDIEKSGGADVVLDITGGDFVMRNLTALNPGGRHVSIAFLRGMEATINVMMIMRKRLTLTGSTMKARDTAEKARLARDIRTHVWPLIEKGAFQPVIDRTFPMEDAANAHRHMESGAHIGKIVLKMNKV